MVVLPTTEIIEPNLFTITSRIEKTYYWRRFYCGGRLLYGENIS